MRINQNIMAFNAYRNLNTTSNLLASSLEKLSSGFRINRAADDAAGLVKSESLRAEIGGTNQAISNAQDGVSFVQTAEGSLNEVQAILQRVRDLAVSAANTATTDGAAQQAEINQLNTELDAIGTRTTLGATQNRFEHIVANLSVAAENLTSSESRTRDTDMSLEMVQFTRDQIMNQAGTAMLAQANQVPQSVLKLLQ